MDRRGLITTACRMSCARDPGRTIQVMFDPLTVISTLPAYAIRRTASVLHIHYDIAAMSSAFGILLDDALVRTGRRGGCARNRRGSTSWSGAGNSAGLKATGCYCRFGILRPRRITRPFATGYVSHGQPIVSSRCEQSACRTASTLLRATDCRNPFWIKMSISVTCNSIVRPRRRSR